MAKGIKQYKYKEFHGINIDDQLNTWLDNNPQIIIHDIKYAGCATQYCTHFSALVEYEEVALKVDIHKYDGVKAMQLYTPVS